MDAVAMVRAIDELVEIAKENEQSSIIISSNPPMGIVILNRFGKAAILTELGLFYKKAPVELGSWLAEERAWPFDLVIAREYILEVLDVEATKEGCNDSNKGRA